MKANKDGLIFGRNPIREALEERVTMNKVFIANNLRGEFEKEIRRLTNEMGVPLQYVDPFKLKKLARGINHQGIAALISPVPFYEINQVVSLAFENGEQPLIVVLDGVTDVRNFGAIARSAEVLGAHGILIGMKDAAPINDVAVKTSAGALLRIPVCRCSSLQKQLAELKNYGLHIFGADMNAEKTLTKCNFLEPLALVLGSEEQGIRPSVQAELDQGFKIPQIGQTESLNVSVAAGIVLYEISRQRNLSKT
jgi:23S rRNA (guanosine2251-2'-O)-methyltransferase